MKDVFQFDINKSYVSIVLGTSNLIEGSRKTNILPPNDEHENNSISNFFFFNCNTIF